MLTCSPTLYGGGPFAHRHGAGRARSTRPVIVDTPYGRLLGAWVHAAAGGSSGIGADSPGAAGGGDGRVARFLGIPYAAAPVGRRRLRSPVAPAPWPGVRDALAIGAPSLQTLKGNQTWLYEPLPPTSEDCLYLNVWTPDVDGELPVLVWFHGGATRNGHGGAGAFDGARLAQRGWLVVVTVSYRLGALGGLAHPYLADPETGECANWGLQDKIAALQFVRECAGAFGGDAGNITVAGQSSGAMHVALLAQHPDLRRLFHKAVLQSPPLFQPPMFAELADAAEYTELLADSLGVGVGGLPGVDGRSIFEAEGALIRSADVIARMGRPRTSPVRDGRLVREWPYHAAPAEIPVLVGWTRDEARFWYELRDTDGTLLSPQRAPQTEEALEEQVDALIRLYYPFSEAPPGAEVLETYREALAAVDRADPAAPVSARPADDAAGETTEIDVIWNEIYTDLVFRAPIVHHAGRHAAAGSPTFAYEFAYPLPPPGTGSPHAADVPFVFGTTASPHVASKVGGGAHVERLSRMMMDLWASFARTGRPAAAGVGAWAAWRAGAPAVLILGGQSAEGSPRQGDASPGPIGSEPLRRSAQLACWPAFRP